VPFFVSAMTVGAMVKIRTNHSFFVMMQEGQEKQCVNTPANRGMGRELTPSDFQKGKMMN